VQRGVTTAGPIRAGGVRIRAGAGGDPSVRMGP
jgi:hypothetical protein